MLSSNLNANGPVWQSAAFPHTVNTSVALSQCAWVVGATLLSYGLLSQLRSMSVIFSVDSGGLCNKCIQVGQKHNEATEEFTWYNVGIEMGLQCNKMLLHHIIYTPNFL